MPNNLNVNTNDSDIPYSGTAANTSVTELATTFVSAFRKYFSEESSRIATNAQAYVNARVSNNPERTSLKRILKDATFVPAAPTRFQAGGFMLSRVKYFVIHRPSFNASESSVNWIINEFSNDRRAASTHFIIGLDGSLVQMVDLEDIAWHCGGSKPCLNINSVGVELEGEVYSPFSAAQLYTLAKLMRTVSSLSQFTLDREHVFGHQEIKIVKDRFDPGPNFPYAAVIAAANKMPAETLLTAFAPPTDILSTAGVVLASVYGAAATAQSAILMQELNKAAAATAAVARATNLRFTNTDYVNTHASEHARLVSEYQQSLLAQVSRTCIQVVSTNPTPQTNTLGVQFDVTTGLWNDGKAV